MASKQTIVARLKQKSRWYWVRSAMIFIVILLVQPYVLEIINIKSLRNHLFLLLSTSSTNPAQPREVKLILIEDHEYWFGELEHRVPTNRSYLAKLVRAADKANARAIAIDFDFRVPDPKMKVLPGDYQKVESSTKYLSESKDFVRVIGDVAQRRPIILGKRMTGPIDGPFELSPDFYQAYGICTALRPDGSWQNGGTKEFPLTPQASANISCGYIALMTDKRRVPPSVDIVSSTGKLDSFPIAIARSLNPPEAINYQSREHYYASYIPEKMIKNDRVTISSKELLDDPNRASVMLRGWPVIIGAAWHQSSFGEGSLVDLHDTPIGDVSGVLIHENLTEAILSGRTYLSPPEYVSVMLDIIAGIIFAIIFALFEGKKILVLIIFTSMAALFLLQWLILQLFASFIDLFIPVFGLGLHALVARIAESRNLSG